MPDLIYSEEDDLFAKSLTSTQMEIRHAVGVPYPYLAKSVEELIGHG